MWQIMQITAAVWIFVCLTTNCPVSAGYMVDDDCSFSTNGECNENEVLPRPLCPHEYAYNRVRNTCIKFNHSQELSWHDSRLVCIAEGGDLVVLSDEASAELVDELMPIINLEYWIGLHKADPLVYSTYKWVDGSRFQHEHWKVGYPENPDGGSGCVAATLGSREWNNHNCFETRAFVCESRSVSRCTGNSWIQNPATDKCYKINPDIKSWDESRHQCTEEGGDLVVLADRAAKEFVIDLIYPSLDQAPRYWIGLKRDTDVDNNTIRWIDGSVLDPMSRLMNIDSVEESCGTLEFGGGDYVYFYTDSHCLSSTFPSICEKEISIEYPVVECPHGYTTYDPAVVSEEGNIMCLMAEHQIKLAREVARGRCQSEGYRSILDPVTDQGLLDFIQDRLMYKSKSYWIPSTERSCLMYKDRKTITKPCSDSHLFVCRYAGLFKSMVNINEVSMHMDIVSFRTADGWKHLTVGLICKFPTLSAFLNAQFGMNSTSVASVTALIRVNHKSYSECVGTPEQQRHVCCIEVAIDKDTYSFDTFEFSAASIFCQCPTTSTTIASFSSTPPNSTPTTRNISTSSETTPTTRNISISSETTPTTRNISTSSEPTPTTRNISTSSETTPTPRNISISSEPTPTTRNISTSSETTPTTRNISTSSETTPTTRNISTSSETTPTTRNISTSSETTPTTRNISTSSETTPTPRNISTSSETTPTPRNIPTSSETTPATRDIPTSSETTPLDTTSPPPPPQDPKPISQENVQILKNLTSPQNKNGSNPPNKLCPCRCDRATFDPNPSPEALLDMLSKIKKELKVETTQLSKSKSKKISAKDSRAESQIIGYFSLVLFLIPFSIIGAFDLIRLIQYIDKKKQKKFSKSSLNKNKETVEVQEIE